MADYPLETTKFIKIKESKINVKLDWLEEFLCKEFNIQDGRWKFEPYYSEDDPEYREVLGFTFTKQEQGE